MIKPDTISQAYWDELSDAEKQFVIKHEQRHAEFNAALAADPALDDLQWDEMWYAQGVDRAYVAARYAEEHLQGFELFKHRPVLKEQVDHIVEALYDLYQSVAQDEDDWNEERALAGKDEAAIEKYYKDKMEKNWPDPFVCKSDAVDDIAKAMGFDVISHRIWKGEL